MNKKLYTFLAAITGGAIALTLTLAHTALADSNPATDQVPKLIPYQGTLEKDGVGVTAQIPMTFSIFDGAAATTAVWTERQTVNVYAGRFMALLGSTTANSATNLAKAITDADNLYLSVTLNNPSGDVALSNRQRFLPVPFALWTTAAADFKVGRNLTVATDISAGRNITATEDVYSYNLHATSKAYIGNAIVSKYSINTVPWADISGPDGGGLSLNNNFGGPVKVWNDLQVGGTARLGRTTKQCSSANSCTCDAWNALSGGVVCNSTDYVSASHPTLDTTTWFGQCRNITSHAVTTPASTYVICARVGAD
jgi:hypothetical protein